jgi:hypothetical protein
MLVKLANNSIIQKNSRQAMDGLRNFEHVITLALELFVVKVRQLINAPLMIGNLGYVTL